MAKRIMVLVGTTKGLFTFESDSNRRNWTCSGPHLGGWEVYSVLGDARQSNRIFAGTSHAAYGPSLRVSTDLGQSWTQIAEGPSYSMESGFALNRVWQLVPGHPSEPNVLYAGVEEAGLFVSRDNGQTWRELDALTKHPTRPGWFPGAGGLCLHTILIHPDNPRRIWVGISAVGVFRTDDAGQSWHPCNEGLARVPVGTPHPEVGYCVHKMVLDPDDPDTLYMQYHQGVFQSKNAGESWFPIEDGLPGGRISTELGAPFGFPIAVSRSGDLFLVPLESSEQRTMRDGRLLVYGKRREGDRWKAVGDVVPDEPRHVNVLRDSLTVDSLEPYGVYFGTTSGEVFYSLDGGVGWDRMPGQYGRILCVKTWIREEQDAA
ncbi:MAG: exo-alpha-sialidase [Chloroflexota bacterium]|nr:exo-alpha-sialidase [Chloroflexota bacterium]